MSIRFLHHRTGARAFLWLLTAIAFAAPAYSAEPDSSRGVADTVTVLPPVEVDADREPALVRQTSTTVRLNRAGVTRFLPSSSGDALLAVPGVDLVKTGPWASRISLRGLSGDRVLVMVDGVRVNGVRGHGAQASLVSVDRLDAVELMPGASSAQHGSDAMGGVVNLVTHRSLLRDDPQLGMSLHARGAAPGDTWKQTTRARWSTPRAGVELSGGLGELGALVTPDGTVRNSGHREEEYAGRAQVLLGRSLIDYEHGVSAARDVGLPAFNGSDGASGSYPLQDRRLHRLEVTLPSLGGFVPDARLLAVHQRFGTEFTETTVDSVFVRGRFVGTRTTRTEDRVRTPGWSLRPEFTFRPLANLQIAGEYRREETSGPRSENVVVRNGSDAVTSDVTTTGESMPPSTRDVWGASAFASGTLRTLKLEAGARWDHMDSHADSTPTSNTSRLDVIDERVSIEGGIARAFGPFEPYLHAATGFRAPNLQERYYNDDIHGGLRLFGNPDLVAERSVSWEGGLRITDLWGGRLRALRLSAYRSDVDDLITFAYIGQLYLIPRFQYVNVERARIEGLELTSNLRFGQVGLDLNASLPRGVNRATGETLLDAGTARVTADLTAPIPLWIPAGRAAFRFRWNDAVTNSDPSIARPAFSTVAIELSTVVARTRAVLSVRNVLNAAYREPLSFIDEPGRTFALSLQREWTLPLTTSRRPSP